MSQAAGSTAFIALHLAWFVVWFGANAISVHPFDPFPYSLLTLVVSLEAIVLTAFVLMSQNRAAKEAPSENVPSLVSAGKSRLDRAHRFMNSTLAHWGAPTSTT